MSVLLQILAANVLTRAFSLGAAALLSYRWLARLSDELLAAASGLLLAISLTHLIPEAFETTGADAHALGFAMLFTVLVFLILERLFSSTGTHSHGTQAEEPDRRAGAAAMMAGAGLHSFVDGVLIASTFMVSEGAGWLAALAVIIHEIPQTTGFMIILKNAGLTARRALFWCAAAASMAVLGALVGWGAVSWSREVLPFALAMSAASFLFITLHTLLPEIVLANASPRAAFGQFVLFLCGVLLSVVLLGTEHGHEHVNDVEAHVEETAHGR